MIYVLLQLKVYTMIVRATSQKHWDLLDKGAVEIDNGSWWEMLELDQSMQRHDPEDVFILTKTSMIQTSEECLKIILEINPDFLNDKWIV